MRKVMAPMLLLAFLLGAHAVVVAEEMQSVTITSKRPISWWDVVDMRQARDALAESYAKDIRSDPREGPRDGKTTDPAAQILLWLSSVLKLLVERFARLQNTKGDVNKLAHHSSDHQLGRLARSL